MIREKICGWLPGAVSTEFWSRLHFVSGVLRVLSQDAVMKRQQSITYSDLEIFTSQ